MTTVAISRLERRQFQIGKRRPFLLAVQIVQHVGPTSIWQIQGKINQQEISIVFVQLRWKAAIHVASRTDFDGFVGK
jgi:hypothetical protein